MPVTNSELNSLKTKFSVKNFITELPNMLNNALTTMCNCITDFYIPDERKLKCPNAEIGTIECTTLVAQNISVKGPSSSQYNYGDLPAIIEHLQEQIDQLASSIDTLARRDIVISDSSYESLDPKDPSKFYYVYDDEQ